MIGRAQLPWLFLATAMIVIHETTWYTAPYWLPFVRMVITAIGNPVLPIVVGLLTMGILGYLNKLDDGPSEVPAA